MTTNSKKTCDACHKPITSGYLCDSCTELALAEIVGPPVQIRPGRSGDKSAGEASAILVGDSDAGSGGSAETEKSLFAGLPLEQSNQFSSQQVTGLVGPPNPIPTPQTSTSSSSQSIPLVIGQPYQPDGEQATTTAAAAATSSLPSPPMQSMLSVPLGQNNGAIQQPPYPSGGQPSLQSVTLEQVKAAAREGRADPYVGRTMQGYHILKRLGVGGMAAVYLAEQLDLQRKIALKIMFPSQGDRADKKARFFREAKAASQLHKDNIATIYNYGSLPDGSLFIAMEMVDGPSLGTVLKSEGSLPLERSLDLAIQIGEGLGIAHAKNIVHRDLKPDNILLASGLQGHEVPKIVDFGIAVMVDEATVGSDGQTPGAGLAAAAAASLTEEREKGRGKGKGGGGKGEAKSAEMVRGTPIYMSPEQARGDAVDARSDIYSFGVILYYMLTGQYPIKADSPLAYLKAHQIQIPQPPGLLVPYEMPSELDALIMTCLEKHPDNRPSDMVTVISILKSVRARLLGLAGGGGGGGELAGARDEDGAGYGLDDQYVDSGYEQAGRGRLPRWVWAIIGVAFLAAAGVAAYAYYYILPPPVGRSAVFDGHTKTGSTVLSSSSDSLPEWMEEVDNGVPPAYSGSNTAFPQVGRSGPISGSDEGRGMVVNDVLERVALRVMDEAREQGLAMLMRGLIGGVRGELDGQFRASVQKSVLAGPDAESDEICRRFANGQKQVAGRVSELLWKGKQSLRAGNVYWEKYQPPGAASLMKKDFYLVWGQVSLTDENVQVLRDVLTKNVTVGGMTLIDFYPSLAWRFPTQKGVLVTQVDSSSPADIGGFVIGDLIVKIGRTQVTSVGQVAELVKGAVRTGSKLQVEVARPSTTDSSIENKVLSLTASSGSFRRPPQQERSHTSPAAPFSRPARTEPKPSAGGDSIFE